MMELFDAKSLKLAETAAKELSSGNIVKVAGKIDGIICNLYENIPDDKRIGYGIVYTIKTLSAFLFKNLILDKNELDTITGIFDTSSNFRSRCTALGIISHYGVKNCKKVFPYFMTAGSSDDWEVREISQMFFRKIIKPNRDEVKEFLARLSESDNPNTRRFTGETLRPVCENKWFFEQPDYHLPIIRKMFKEPVSYPRTSIGNGLSDLSRGCPELVFGIVDELVSSKDKNSYWIAYRACRNLVKKEPLRVMRLLKVESYKYKDRDFKKADL